jgi:hypothetical protein
MDDAKNTEKNQDEATKNGNDLRRRRGSSTAERAASDAFWKLCEAAYTKLADDLAAGNVPAVAAVAAIRGK